ncbi:TPA: hypothetical protein N0F65_002129 [Lagenidium giganteum]|uniref:Membrane magnesium transporter n=1 Tax=Lagenidium giganteum TaxID=4803 RepID=A0AAV2ZGH3_9STRA|nr:TPA: hypothetical protein N0F65_002129 [Lagenidium giganteum]
MIGKLFVALGAILLLHAGYYAVQYAEYVRLAEVSDAQVPPVAVMIELVLSFVFCLIGVLIVSGEMVPIRSSEALHSRSLPNVVSSPEFHVFNHRGKALHKRLVTQ